MCWGVVGNEGRYGAEEVLSECGWCEEVLGKVCGLWRL